MNNITTIIFDLGGVLVDWNPRYLFKKVFDNDAEVEHFLENICTQHWNEQQDAGRSIAEANRELIEMHPQHRDNIEAYYGRWEEMLQGTIEGSVEILTSLHNSRTHKLLALTNWSAETFPIAKERFSFFDCFEDILVSGEIGLKKPDSRIFNMLLEKHDLSPGETLFIDDALHNVEAATALGINAIQFESVKQLEDQLSQYL